MNNIILANALEASQGHMVDGFGRDITYLRVPVTDRCDFRCVYCIAEDMTFLPKRDLLSIEELQRLGAHLRACRDRVDASWTKYCSHGHPRKNANMGAAVLR